MEIVFLSNAWEDYLFWRKTDEMMLKNINELIKQCARSPFEGIGKPEALKADLSGWWSRRINQEHRLVYRVKNSRLLIAQCRKHY